MQNYCTVQAEAALKTQWGECNIILQIKKNTHIILVHYYVHAYCGWKTAEIEKLVKIKKTFFYDVFLKENTF